MPKIVIVAPFWRQSGHVGNYRVDRFVRWLSEEGDEIVLIRAGEHEASSATAWGTEITIRDPLGMYRDCEGSNGTSARSENAFRRRAAYWIFNPDPTVVWSRRAASHPLVSRLSRGAEWVLSSSPPESVHVMAAGLARRTDANLIVDLRDGWLDEPLKPITRDSSLRRWREGRLESTILRQAHRIFVTSAVWGEKLSARLPYVASKTAVITNAYPLLEFSEVSALDNKHLTLLYTGRLQGSREAQSASLLLASLLPALQSQDRGTGTIVFLGSFSRKDLSEMAEYDGALAGTGWNIKVEPSVARQEMFCRMSRANGLLLLSASEAAVPGKTFEYIWTRKPVLAICPQGSSVWQMAQDLPQFFCADYRTPEISTHIVKTFLAACREGCSQSHVPSQYSEAHLKEIFLEQLQA